VDPIQITDLRVTTMLKRKINITVPKLNKPGGVASFYNAVLPHMDDKSYEINILEIGSTTRFPNFLKYVIDQFRFNKTLTTSTELVHINPSLGFKSFIRDGLFIMLAKRKGIPVLVFFHGWNQNFEQRIKKSLFWFFKMSFARADAFIVLASTFETFLRDSEIQAPIYIETTAIDENLINAFNIDNKIQALSSAKTFPILFLSRLEREKGAFETIDAVKLLINQGLPVTLSIAGDGSILDELKDYAKQQLDNHVQFLGYVSGDEKVRVFSEHSVYCFPTNYGEGLPTSVLEAMAFGLPVVTRPVAGLADHFKDGLMGKLCHTMDPKEIAESIKFIINDPSITKIARYNHEHAVNTFMASKVAERLSNIYQSTLKH